MTTEGQTKLTFRPEYTTPYNAFIRDDVVMGVPRYFIERWLPLLGPDVATVVNTLRQLNYRCQDDEIMIGGEALAREASMSRRHLYTCLAHPYRPMFITHETGPKRHTKEGQIVQLPNRYKVRMDDPITPPDAEYLIQVLETLGDNPFDAARRALAMEPRDLWAPSLALKPVRFRPELPMTANAALALAFPRWYPETDEIQHDFNRIAEALHRHITLVRDDGRASKIIVPQYFRRRWWDKLGHELAWTYLYLRGCVYDGEGEQRDTCWIPSLNTLLTLIQRTREWWRRNVEHAKPHASGWSLSDFFEQLDAVKGRNPAQPQWVARRFRVALTIPITPEDRPLYDELLTNWPLDGKGVTPPPPPPTVTPLPGSIAPLAAPEPKVLHNETRRLVETVPQPDTPVAGGSDTASYSGGRGVRHSDTHRSATNEHTESESNIEALPTPNQPSSSSKHTDSPPPPDSTPEKTAAAAESEKSPPQADQFLLEDDPRSLFDQLVETLEKAPETPLYRSARARAWLREAWDEPVRPHSPAWDGVMNGMISPRDLVAMMLAVSADTSVHHPPRYLSWLVARWTRDSEPVPHWPTWQRLAELPLNEWPETGRDEWIEMAPPSRRELPFGLAAIYEPEEDEEDSSPPNPPIPLPAAPPPSSPAEPDGLDDLVPDTPFTARDLWTAVKGHLSLQLNRDTYEGLIKDCVLVSFKDGVLTLKARHITAKTMLDNYLHVAVDHAILAIARRAIPVKYIADLPRYYNPNFERLFSQRKDKSQTDDKPSTEDTEPQQG